MLNAGALCASLSAPQVPRRLPLAAGWRPAGARQLASRPARGGRVVPQASAAAKEEEPKQQGHQAPASSAANLEVQSACSAGDGGM